MVERRDNWVTRRVKKKEKMMGREKHFWLIGEGGRET